MGAADPIGSGLIAAVSGRSVGDAVQDSIDFWRPGARQRDALNELPPSPLEVPDAPEPDTVDTVLQARAAQAARRRSRSTLVIPTSRSTGLNIPR